MAIKVLKREQSVQPVGIIKSDTFDANAELAKDIANTATNIMGVAFQRGAEEAKAKGIETANTIKMKKLNPEEGFVEIVDTPATFGRIATESFQNTMNKRYIDSIEHSMRLELKKFSLDPNNRDMMNNPALYQEKATELVASFVKASPQQYQGMVQQFGTQLVGAGLTDVTINQHKNAMKKINTSFLEQMGVNFIEMNNVVSNAMETGDFSEAVSMYNMNEDKIEEMQPFLSETDYKKLKNKNTFNYIEQAITSHMSTLNKAQAQRVNVDWRENKWIQGEMSPEIQKAMDSIPKTGRFNNIKQEIERTINSLVATKTAESVYTGDYGSLAGGKEVLNEAMKNENLVLEDNTIDYSSNDYTALVQKYGQVDPSLIDLATKYLSGNLGADPDGQVGFRLYQIWNNLAYQRSSTGRSDVIDDTFFSGTNAQKFFETMLAIDKYMQIDTNEEQFVKAFTHFNRSKAEKDSWVLAIGKDLGIDEPTETKLRNKIMTDLMDGPYFSEAMSEAEANQFVDGVILYQAMSHFGDDKFISTADAIAKIRETVRTDFQEDIGIINPNGMFAVTNIIEKIPNPDAGKVVGMMGVYTKADPYFTKKRKVPMAMRTRFSLNKVFDNMGFAGGADRFKSHVEEIVKLNFAEDEDNEIYEKFSYGKDIYLMPQRNSTVENPLYNVLIRDPETDTIIPLIMNGHQLALDVSDFKNSLAKEARDNELMSESIQQKGLVVSHLTDGKLNSEYQKQVVASIKASKKKFSKVIKETPVLGGVGVSGFDLLNLELNKALESDGIVDEETFIEKTIDVLRDTPDHLHQIVFGRESRYPVGAGIEAIERNNPTNIRFNNSNQWRGKMGDDGSGFETFEDNAHAFRATALTLHTYNKLYFDYKMTIPQMINRWAPPSENDTKSYIDHVLSVTGMSKDDIVDTKDDDMMLKIIKTMTKHEIGANNFNSYDEWDLDILDGIRMANMDKL